VDKPIIQYGVEEALAAGCDQVIMVTGRGKRAIEDYFDHSYELEHLLESRGQLARVRHRVSADLEITEITDRVSKGPPEHNRALLFEQVEGSTVPVAINLFGSAQRMAWALGVEDLDELGRKLAGLLDLRLPEGLGGALNRGIAHRPLQGVRQQHPEELIANLGGLRFDQLELLRRVHAARRPSELHGAPGYLLDSRYDSLDPPIPRTLSVVGIVGSHFDAQA